MPDALLEDGRLSFEGLSGSRDGARRTLADFWSALGKLMPSDFVVTAHGEHIGLSAASKMMMKWAGLFSPTQLNPLGHNARRELLKEQVDFGKLRRDGPFKLFIGAGCATGAST